MTNPYDPYPRDPNDPTGSGSAPSGGFGSPADSGPYGPYGAGPQGAGAYGIQDAPNGFTQDGYAAPGPYGPPSPGPYGTPPHTPYGPPGGPFGGYAPGPAFASVGQPGPAPATAGEAASRAFTLFGRHAGVLIGVVAVWGIPLVFLTFTGNIFASTTTMDGYLAGGFGAATFFHLVSNVVGAAAQVSLAAGTLRLVRFGRASFSEFFVLPRTWWLYALIVGAVSVTTNVVPNLALAAAVAVVFLVAGVAFIFAPFHLADGASSPFAAFAASARTVGANFGHTLLLLLICFGLYLAGALVCGVGLLAAVPIITLSLTLFYCGARHELVAP